MADPQDELEALKTQVASLTARVHKLEQQCALVSETQPPTTPGQPPTALRTPVVHPLPVEALLSPEPQAEPSVLAAARKGAQNLERRIGQYWLNRVGIVAILIGASYFLKYAFENNWIGQAGRIAIGLVAGIGLVIWSERFRKRGHAAFSHSLKALGIGVLYLSLWAAFQLYHLIPAQVAFAVMVIVTAATIALAVTQDAQLLAALALMGGFSTPVLVSSGENHEVVLFSYICLLDLAILVIAMSRPWRRMLWGSFVGTVVLNAGWYKTYYSGDQRPVTVLFAALFAAIFAAIPLVTPYRRSTRFPGPSVTLTLLPLLNAAVLFLALREMYQHEMATLTWCALALAAIYLGIGSALRRRSRDSDTRVITLVHVGIAVAFITVAIPLKLHVHWITIGWLIESAALLWIGVRTRTNFLRNLAIVTLALGVSRLLVIDRFHTERLIFNPRFATYLVAIAILCGVVGLGGQHASEREKVFINVATAALNLLALIALTREASDYFNQQLNPFYAQHGPDRIRYGQSVDGMTAFRAIRLARDFSYSAVWLIYGAALMAVGFWRRRAFVRRQALVLIAFTIGKVFIYDVLELDRGYRVLSFIALGAVLLGISFVYQRDWLRLTSGSAEESNK
jgi:uncharacterized membrane protein